MSRRRPLHTCGASVLAIIHSASRKAQELNGPLGTLTKRVTKFVCVALPFIHAVQYQWLAILSFTDDRILTLEKLVETIFPPSTHFFDKIDKLVYTAEVMPGKFDDALNRFPGIVHRVPFLDWVLMQIIWWLNFLISILTHRGRKSLEEKDIMIDINCNTCSNVTESVVKAKCPSEESPSVFCPPQEKILEVGKAKSHVELPTVAESKNKEKLLPVLDSLENEVKPDDSSKCTVESSAKNQSENLISAPLLDSSQGESKSITCVQLPSVAAPLGGSSQDESKSVDHVEFLSIAAPLGSSQDKIKSVKHVEFPSIIAPLGSSFQDETKSVSPVELPSTANNEEQLHLSEILEADASQDEPKSIGVKLGSGIVEGTDKEMLGKGRKDNMRTKADKAQKESEQSKVIEQKAGTNKGKETKKSIEEKDQKDPILDLFESRWHL